MNVTNLATYLITTFALAEDLTDMCCVCSVENLDNPEQDENTTWIACDVCGRVTAVPLWHEHSVGVQSLQQACAFFWQSGRCGDAGETVSDGDTRLGVIPELTSKGKSPVIDYVVSLSAVFTVTLDLIQSSPVHCEARRSSKNHTQIAQ
ncbi:hypothetical protein AMECASPLE_034570 [Ameca splendens]|uniref:Uncharacterized protein n=1 Tax=Ameca splendens TaxID=208324 RepID=A0ABV1A2W8_9TELE